jgi:hypothetical protein
MPDHTRTFLAAACLLLAGCPTAGTQPEGPRVELAGVGDPEHFPMEASGFRRGNFFTIEGAPANFGVTYATQDPALRHSVTFTVLYEAKDPARTFELEKRGVIAQGGVNLIEEEELVFTKNGKPHRARVASFGKSPDLYTELVLVPFPDRFVRVLSNAPLSQATVAEARLRALMETVNWAAEDGARARAPERP